ncbi:DUF4159 domain-containing protein [soil metagenome]
MSHRRSKILLITLISIATFCAGLQPARAATPEEVDDAIKKAIDVLYSTQKGDNWENGAGGDKQETGLTALVVYGLLAAGEKPQTPKIAAAIEYLKKNPTKGIYALGLRAQVWNLIPHDKDESVRNAIKGDAVLLLEGAKNASGTGYRGLYHYLVSQKDYDASCSQYGVLGMWAMDRAGLEVSDDYWKAVENAWKKNQNSDNGWGYIKSTKADAHSASKLSMTAAGIATLFITQDYLSGAAGLKCTGNTDNAAIDKGMSWMEKNLGNEFKSGKVNLYSLYGVERIGVASGYKYFGQLDWYKVGADQLIKKQAPGGGWTGDKMTGERSGSSAFGILFLCRGRAPVVMNKLQYKIDGKEANWNERPRDAANVVKYIAKQMERDLNFQIVNLSVPVEDLHDSPILYIPGNQALKFTAAEEAKLKEFVEQGGLILGNADCGSAEFSKSFKALGMKLFPEAGEFRDITGDHPMFTRQRLWKTWKTKPVVQGLSNKVRELMLLIPSGDPAKAWQQADNKSKEDQFQLLSEIFLYAVEGADLRNKGATYIVTAKPAIKATQSIKVARLEVGENPNPEPGGWRRLAAVMHNSYGTDIDSQLVKPAPDTLKDFKVAHLTGTGKLKLTAEQQKAIKDFVEGGGTLIIDAAGGDTEFAGSVEDDLGAMFGKDASQLQNTIAPDNAIFNAASTPVGPISFRPYARGKIPRGTTTPLLHGITIKGRLAVIFSREDLSGALVGESIDGIIGYTPDSASAIMANLLTYASGGKKAAPAPPASGPTTKPASVASKAERDKARERTPAEEPPKAE